MTEALLCTLRVCNATQERLYCACYICVRIMHSCRVIRNLSHGCSKQSTFSRIARQRKEEKGCSSCC